MTTKKKQEISTRELKRKYNNWMKNFVGKVPLSVEIEQCLTPL
jgi:hypothetical protein